MNREYHERKKLEPDDSGIVPSIQLHVGQELNDLLIQSELPLDNMIPVDEGVPIPVDEVHGIEDMMVEPLGEHLVVGGNDDSEVSGSEVRNMIYFMKYMKYKSKTTKNNEK
jgi:hypothetical protein